VLLITGAASEILKGFSEDPQELQMRFALLRNLKHVQLQDAGHNLQHDQPEQVARLIEEFLPQ
jgi:pimeloyl-ACP methyl ester carboxylesterase